MGLFDNFPYTNFHELNLDWILRALKEIEKLMDQFVALNSLKYADPIQWDITSQYEKNTIVIEPVTGTAYISVQPVPSGVAISNTDYWSVVFDLSRFIIQASQNFANSYEANYTTTATMPTIEGGWLVWNGTLYQALTDIHPGDAYVEDGNIKRMTVEDFFNILDGDLKTEAQTRADEDTRIELELTDLITSKVDIEARTRADEDLRIELELSDLIASEVTARIDADNIIENMIGDLSTLDTTNKDNLVDAINEVNYKIDNMTSGIYYNVLDYGAVGDGVHDDTAAFRDAIAAANSNRGVVFIPDTANHYVISQPLTLGSYSYIKGENRAEIHFSSTNLFEVSNYYGSIENLFIVGNTTNNAIWFDLDAHTVWFWRFNHLHIRSCVHAFYDTVVGNNYIVDCIFNDVTMDYTYGTQFKSNRSRGFITLRNFKVDNTENRRDIAWDSISISDVIGLEMEAVDVVGPVSRGSYVVNQYQNVWGIRIQGSGSGRASIWLSRVLVDTAPINGIIISSIAYINANYIEAFSVAGNCLFLSSCQDGNLTNVYCRGLNGTSYAAAGASGLTLNGCARINVSNAVGEHNTGSGFNVYNTGKCSLSNVQAQYNGTYGYYESGTSDSNSVVNAHYNVNTTGGLVQSGAQSIHTSVDINSTTTASIKGVYSG